MKPLIDADILRYRIGFVCQHTKYYVLEKGHEKYGPVLVTLNKDEATALTDDDSNLYIKEFIVAEHIAKCLHSLKLQLQSILNKFDCDKEDAIVYLSGKDNFRDRLVDYYKANRDRAARPIHYPKMTDYLLQYWDAQVVHGIEADDALGIEQMKNYNEGMGMVEETCIVSLDKDLDCIPGYHYNFVKDELYCIDTIDADRNFFAQMIQGDGADNIPGLFKITGQKASAQLFTPLSMIEDYDQMWMYVWNVYWKSYCKQVVAKEIEEPVYNRPGDLLPKLREIGQLLWIWRKDNDLWNIPNTIFEEMEVDV